MLRSRYSIVRFLLNMGIVYAAWRLFKYLAEHYENFLWGGWAKFQQFIGNTIATYSVSILRLAGYEVYNTGRMIYMQGHQPIYVADQCLGIAPLVIFTGFIVSFGNNTRNKLWYIPFGILLIMIINIIRMMALVLVAVHKQAWFGFAHNYLYVAITYSLILALVIWWMERWAFLPGDKAN
ncbi:MAG: archaeosortase/exosortase family protein [Chitinophagales bacterium]|nr:archaeosortase/exosortase family protein [Chitinophagales bacterium]MDW8419462.1 archaeosortase/exosortase family protein [Chitinophagales bacterium]